MMVPGRRHTNGFRQGLTGRCPHGGAARWALGLASALALIVPGLAASAPAMRPPTITPPHGQPFRPALGDWEGTAGGFPVSFQLQLSGSAAAPYSLAGIVALVPAGCPKVAYHYSEAVIDSKTGVAVGVAGGLGLTQFGFTGRFAGARSATMSTPFGNHHCGQLTWKLHPAHRATVQDGPWRVAFADGESSRFSVIGRGRLAAGLVLPKALRRCNGATGAIDLFIAASGRAGTDQPHVRASIRFTASKAAGQINAGGAGCASGPIAFTARRL